MALELVIVAGLVLLILACLGFGAWSGLKIFFVLGFVSLAFLGFFVWTSNGVVLEKRPVSFPEVDGVLSVEYEDVVLGYDSAPVFWFSQFCFWVGLVLTVWSVFFTSMFQASEVKKVFVWS